MIGKQDIKAIRKSLQDLVAGGCGEAPGYIYEMKQPDEYGNRFKLIEEDGIGGRIALLTKTREQAQALLDISKLEV